MIILHLTLKCESPYLIISSDKINLSILKDVFDIYRGRLRGLTKMMNNLHLNILSNFSNIDESEEKAEQTLATVTADLKAFYKMSPNYKKRLGDFRSRKRNEFEIHEMITKIGANVTKNEKNSSALIDSVFYDDIIEYLIIIANSESEDDNKVSLNCDFMIKMKEKKKKMNFDEIKRIVFNIVNNSITIILNVMMANESISNNFSSKVKINLLISS